MFLQYREEYTACTNYWYNFSEDDIKYMYDEVCDLGYRASFDQFKAKYFSDNGFQDLIYKLDQSADLTDVEEELYDMITYIMRHKGKKKTQTYDFIDAFKTRS